MADLDLLCCHHTLNSVNSPGTCHNGDHQQASDDDGVLEGAVVNHWWGSGVVDLLIVAGWWGV